ncbi:MAG: hypothetical protein P8Y18_00380 [Candidatus Bathyarchaeota archaeon]
MGFRKATCIVIVISLFLFSCLSNAVFSLSDGWIEWNRMYRGTEVGSLVQTSDGGYAFCGKTNVTDPQGDFLLTKIDSLGNVEWNQTYSGIAYEQANAMIITSDDGYALAGPTSSFGNGLRDFWLVKTDKDGNIEWNQTYGETGPEVPYSLVQTIDGGYALVGVRHSISSDGSDCWMVKTDSEGNMEWSKTLSGRQVDSAFSVIETSDGDLVVLCKEYTQNANYAFVSLTKMNSLGNIEWKQSYEGTFGNYCFSLIETSDGKIAFTCPNYLFDSGGGDFWLVKMSKEGNVELNKTYGGSEKDVPYSLIETSDGGFALAGSTESFGHGNTDYWLVKTDPEGEMEWSRFYGEPEHEICYSLIQASDGGYLLAGNELIWDTHEETIWLVKTNIQGISEFPLQIILVVGLTIVLVLLIIYRNRFSGKKKWLK